MNRSIKFALLISALLLFSAGAQATPTFANVTLDPSLSQAGFNAETICDGPTFPPCASATYSGPSSYTVTFSNIGFFSTSITGAVVDPTGPGAFTLLNFSVFDTTAANVFTGTSLSNLAVIAGVYTIQVNYTFVGSPTSASAGWTMPLTTGPRIPQLPEPGTLALLGLGLAGIGLASRRKKI